MANERPDFTPDKGNDPAKILPPAGGSLSPDTSGLPVVGSPKDGATGPLKGGPGENSKGFAVSNEAKVGSEKWRDDTYQLVRDKAATFIGMSLQDGKVNSIGEKNFAALKATIDLDVAQHGASMYRIAGDGLDRSLNNDYAVQMYLAGALAGDAVSFDRIGTVLEKERDEATETASKDGRGNASQKKLKSLVAGCAKAGIPAHAWIDEYGLDDAQKRDQRMTYYNFQQKELAAGKTFPDDIIALGKTYRDEALGADGDQTDLGINQALRTGYSIFTFDKDPSARRRASQIVQDHVDQLDTYSFTKDDLTVLFTIGKNILRDEEHLTDEQVSWWSTTLARFTGRTMQTEDVPVVFQHALLNQMIDRIDGASVEDIRDSYDQYFIEQLRDEKSVQTMQAMKDSFLSILAENEVVNGRLGDAKVLADSIADGQIRERTFGKLVQNASTVDALAAIKPDELALMVDPNLAARFEAKQAMLERKPAEVWKFALSYANSNADINYNLLRECYTWIEANDPQSAPALARILEDKFKVQLAQKQTEIAQKDKEDPRPYGVISALERQATRAVKEIVRYARVRLARGDKTAIPEIIKYTEKMDDNEEMIEAYVDVAKATAPEIK